jgi:hypothetical protein
MYLLELYRDLRVWRRYYKITKSNQPLLNKNGLRVDALGRIYTVINVTEEASQLPDAEMWVLQQLNPYNKVLLELGISDYSFPEISKIDEPGADAYLVVMYPELNNINGWRIIIEIAKWAVIFVACKVAYNLSVEHHLLDKIANFFTTYA